VGMARSAQVVGVADHADIVREALGDRKTKG
jgi:hypothetical protein